MELVFKWGCAIGYGPRAHWSSNNASHVERVKLTPEVAVMIDYARSIAESQGRTVAISLGGIEIQVTHELDGSPDGKLIVTCGTMSCPPYESEPLSVAKLRKVNRLSNYASGAVVNDVLAMDIFTLH